MAETPNLSTILTPDHFITIRHNEVEQQFLWFSEDLQRRANGLLQEYLRTDGGTNIDRGRAFWMGHSASFYSLTHLGDSPQVFIYMQGWLQIWLDFYLAIEDKEGAQHVADMKRSIISQAILTFEAQQRGDSRLLLSSKRARVEESRSALGFDTGNSSSEVRVAASPETPTKSRSRQDIIGLRKLKGNATLEEDSEDSSPSPVDLRTPPRHDSQGSHVDAYESGMMELEGGSLLQHGKSKPPVCPSTPSYSLVTIHSISSGSESEEENIQSLVVNPRTSKTSEHVAAKSIGTKKPVCSHSSNSISGDDFNLVTAFLKHGYAWPKWLEDSTLQLVGSTDAQIKARFRIMFPMMYGSNALAFIKEKEAYIRPDGNATEMVEWLKPLCRVTIPVKRNTTLRFVRSNVTVDTTLPNTTDEGALASHKRKASMSSNSPTVQIPTSKKSDIARSRQRSAKGTLTQSSPAMMSSPPINTAKPDFLEPLVPQSSHQSKIEKRSKPKATAVPPTDDLREISPPPLACQNRPRRATKTPMRYEPPISEPKTPSRKRKRIKTEPRVVKLEEVEEEEHPMPTPKAKRPKTSSKKSSKTTPKKVKMEPVEQEEEHETEEEAAPTPKPKTPRRKSSSKKSTKAKPKKKVVVDVEEEDEDEQDMEEEVALNPTPKSRRPKTPSREPKSSKAKPKVKVEQVERGWIENGVHHMFTNSIYAET